MPKQSSLGGSVVNQIFVQHRAKVVSLHTFKLKYSDGSQAIINESEIKKAQSKVQTRPPSAHKNYRP
jgi:hypothetical protein